MKHLRNKMAVGATLASLGGLTAVAMSQGTAKRRASTAAPVAADVRTVTEVQTIHRYRHVGLGDGTHGSATQTAAVHVGWAKAAAVATRASGSHTAATPGTTTGGGAHVKSYASGAKGGHGSTRGDASPGKGAPSTKASGARPEKGGSGSGSSPSAPTTKPSGASAPESSGGSTPGTPPTTKSSGATGGSGGSGTGTETTPTSPPTTKPSGAGGGTETGEGSKTEGHEREHDD